MKNHYTYEIDFSGVPLNCCFTFDETAILFGDYVVKKTKEKDCVVIPDLSWDRWIKEGGRRNAETEFTSFTGCVSDALFKYNRMIMHAVCFRRHNKAWLICGASGMGKTTQINSLIRLYPDEFSVICGDRPILEFRDDSSIIAHPSPWNGKENMYGAKAAPLAGVFCLERGDATKLIRLSENEAVVPVLKSIITSLGNEETIHRLAHLENKLLKSVPVWRYVNGGVPDSTRILYDEILRQE